MLNGTPIPDGTSFGLNAAQLAQLVFVAGAAGTSDELSMQVWDGHAVSAIGQFHVNAVSAISAVNVASSNEALSSAPAADSDTFRGVAGEDVHFDFGFPAAAQPAAADHANNHIDLAVPHLIRTLRRVPVRPVMAETP